MNTAERVRRIARVLDELYPDPKGPLTGNRPDPFELLVLVVLSAQTTDKRVLEVAPRLFGLARTPAAMGALPLRAIQGAIASLGLSRTKARYLRELSRKLIERHAGAVPADLAALEDLPGVGHKTASVVMAQAFGAPAFPVDTHIHRLAFRWGLSDGSNVRRTENDLKALFPAEEWHRRHLQMIFFGREYCKAQNHDPAACPICAFAAPPSAGI